MIKHSQLYTDKDVWPVGLAQFSIWLTSQNKRPYQVWTYMRKVRGSKLSGLLS
jgi:hypothetical protein